MEEELKLSGELEEELEDIYEARMREKKKLEARIEELLRENEELKATLENAETDEDDDTD